MMGDQDVFMLLWALMCIIFGAADLRFSLSHSRWLGGFSIASGVLLAVSTLATLRQP